MDELREAAFCPTGRKQGDVAAAVIHIVGGALAAAGLPVLVVGAAAERAAALVVGFSLYGASLLYYFAISTLSHFLEAPGARRVFATLDEAGDFFLIAGSWTPLCLTVFKGPLGWALFGVLWGLALFDFLVALLYTSRAKNLVLAAYYLGVTLILPLVAPFRGLLGEILFAWLVLAGLLYAAGLLFRSRDEMPYHHGIWHAFTLAASICHFFGLLSLL